MELPTCSLLRAELEGGAYGTGVDQPYMATMRHQGVQRALLEVDAIWHSERPEDLRVVRRLYFKQFDGPDSQISDEATLKAIETSSLPGDLDSIARSRVSKAPFVRGEFRPFASNNVGSLVEFLANEWLPEHKVVIVRSPANSSSLPGDVLEQAVLEQDALETQALLRSQKFTKKELDRVLLSAVLSRYDNSTVIRLLLDAGADVNTRTPEGGTPLMNAVSRPCNLHPLLDRGADKNARDKWGRTALDLAEQAKQSAAVRLLQGEDFKSAP